jgi:hypothetical protein
MKQKIDSLSSLFVRYEVNSRVVLEFLAEFMFDNSPDLTEGSTDV